MKVLDFILAIIVSLLETTAASHGLLICQNTSLHIVKLLHKKTVFGVTVVLHKSPQIFISNTTNEFDFLTDSFFTLCIYY